MGVVELLQPPLRGFFCQVDALGVDGGFLDRVNALLLAVGWLYNTALG